MSEGEQIGVKHGRVANEPSCVKLKGSPSGGMNVQDEP